MRPPQAPQPNGRPAGDPPSFTKKD
jgi:hypothetical protein